MEEGAFEFGLERHYMCNGREGGLSTMETLGFNSNQTDVAASFNLLLTLVGQEV